MNKLGLKVSRDEKIPSRYIKSIWMGTTVATNALLERKGEPTALMITKGFKDLLFIGNQSRTHIFDLKMSWPEKLYSEVVEVDEWIIPAKFLTEEEKKGSVIGSNGVEYLVERGLN